MTNHQQENETLRRIVRDLHWMARRYADGRRSYAASLLNEHVKALIALGVELNGADGTAWARDGMGPKFCGLTPEQYAAGKPIDEWQADARRAEFAAGLRRAAEMVASTVTSSQHNAYGLSAMLIEEADRAEQGGEE